MIGKQPVNIVINDVFYGAVRRADNIAAFYNVPKRHSVRKRKFGSAVAVRGTVAIEQSGEYAPKSVLRMRVIKFSFRGFWRKHGAENKYSAFAVDQRRNYVVFGMTYSFHMTIYDPV